MGTKTFFNKDEAIEKLGLENSGDLYLLIRAGVLRPSSGSIKSSDLWFHRKELERVTEVLSGAHPDYARIILDITSRIEKIEQALNIISNIVRPSVADVLFGISEDQIAEITLEAWHEMGKDISLPKMMERLKIASNLSSTHLEFLREEIRDPHPEMVWVGIVSDINAKIAARRRNLMTEDPMFYNQLKILLKAAEANLSRLILIESGPGSKSSVYLHHPRRMVAQILSSENP